MSIAFERRDLIKNADCLVCNKEVAGLLFMEDYENVDMNDLGKIICDKIKVAKIKNLVVTAGSKGTLYASSNGEYGIVKALDVGVVDTTGAGDSFYTGICTRLTYGKTLKEVSEIGTKLAASVVQSVENVCPSFLPSEFNLKVKN